MELETIKTRITSLETKVKTKQEEINRLNEKSSEFE